MTNAEARFSNSLRARKPEGSLGRTAQDGTSTLTQLLSLSVSMSACIAQFDDDRLYSAILRSLEQTLRSHEVLHE